MCNMHKSRSVSADAFASRKSFKNISLYKLKNHVEAATSKAIKLWCCEHTDMEWPCRTTYFLNICGACLEMIGTFAKSAACFCRC